MSALRVGFIGAGNMAQALAKGFIASGIACPSNIIASSPPQDQYLLEEISKIGCETTNSNAKAALFSDVIFISVKPFVVPRILSDISSSVTTKKPLVASVAIGVSLHEMEEKLTRGSRIIRILPNTPVLVKQGASVFSRGTHANAEDGAIITRLLKSVGECDEVPESFLDAVSGLSGAGPAYMYLALEAMADGGVKMGLPRPLSLKLAAQTMVGAAKMVLDTRKPPGQLKDEVCSPGGCTIEGVAALENGGLRAALINAVTNAANKSDLISRTSD